MSKKALLALCVAVLTPLVFFSITEYKSKTAVATPHRYYADSVSTRIRDGKAITDTFWHVVRDSGLINQLGTKVSLDDLSGRVLVVDFFFTHCPSICPTLTRNMKKLQDALKPGDESKKGDSAFVQFLSFSVDPVRDSAAVLKRYADKYGVNPDLWWLLTGTKKSIYDFALNELKMGISDGDGVDSNFIHTQKMVLLDKQHVVRGYYDGLDSGELSKLASDAVFIMLEKDKNRKSELAELRPLLPLLGMVLLVTAFAVYVFSRKRVTLDS